MSEPPFQHEHRVVYAECTLGNHVYYSRYLEIIEAARGEFFRRLGPSCLQLQQSGLSFPVIAVHLQYHAPARYDDLVAVQLWITELGPVRLHFGCRILHPDNRLLVDGETHHVCAGPDEKPKRLPGELAEKLRPFLRSAHKP